MDEHATALADAIEVALPAWVERAVARVLAGAGMAVSAAIASQAAEAGRRAAADVVPRVRRLLAADIDQQRTTPLAILRSAVHYPTEVLRSAGAPGVARDRDQARLFPNDPYDLSPANFADVDPGLTELGLVWGAAKAHAHLQRHRTGSAG